MGSTATDALSLAYAECERIVREGDPDRAVSVGFVPRDRQRALFALYAFYGEVERVRDHISQPMPGEIRLQWWRDQIEAASADAAPGEGAPIAVALLDTIRHFALPADAFDRLLEARIFDLYDDPMPSRTDLEAYAGETASALIVLVAMVLDRDATPRVTEAAGHAGVGMEIVRILRQARRHAARNQIYVPADILAATGVAPSEWLREGDVAGRVGAAMTALAHEHLAVIERHWAGIPRNLRPAFLPTLVAARSIARDSTAHATALSRLWLYWRAMRR